MLQFCRFVCMRFIMAIVTLLMVTLIIFTLMELSAVQYSGRCLTFFNFYNLPNPFDEPVFIRWVYWVKDVFVHGDFGYSCVYRKPINLLLGTKFWISLGLCLSSLLLAYLIAIPVGIY